MTRRFRAFFLAVCAFIAVLDGPAVVRMLARGPDAGLGAKSAVTMTDEARAKAELANLPHAALADAELPLDARARARY